MATSTRPARTYSAPCAHGCGGTVTSRRPIPRGGIGCGVGPCLEAHNAAVRAHQAAPRRPRAPQAEPVAYGDYGALCAFVRKPTR